MTYRSFDDLAVWKRSCQNAVRIYELLRGCKDFALRDQMQRAAISIASNIAEGSERGGADFVRFLRIASGSSAELRTQIYIANRVGMVSNNDAKEIVAELKEISMMLAGLMKSLR